MTRQQMPRIRLRDLRYYAVTGALFGAINALFAFGPKLIKGSLSLSYFPLGVAMFALIGVLAALPVGYFQLRRFRRRLHPRRAKQGRSVALALAAPTK